MSHLLILKNTIYTLYISGKYQMSIFTEKFCTEINIDESTPGVRQVSYCILKTNIV